MRERGVREEKKEIGLPEQEVKEREERRRSEARSEYTFIKRERSM